MIYLVRIGSPAERVLIKNMPMRPGQVIRVNDQEMTSFQKDFRVLDVDVIVPKQNEMFES